MVLGLVLNALWRFGAPEFFAGETLNRATPTLVPEEDDDVVVLSQEPSQAQTDHLAGRGLG